MDVENWTLLASVELDGSSAVRQAREVVRSTSAGMIDRRALADALTATGEVVKNALQHAWGPFMLTVRHQPGSGRLRVGVSDGNPEPPQFAEDDPWAAHGHGLNVLDSLVVAWGATALVGGKDVWFDIDVSHSSE